MNVLAFAWRSLIRQPARAVLGVVGVAAVCALLFDMLLLSRGLVLSMQDLLEQVGFGIRVTATQALPGSGPRIQDASQVAAAIAALPEVVEAVPLVFGDAEVTSANRARPLLASFFAADASTRRPWTIVEGRDLARGAGLTGQVLLNRRLADLLGRRPGEAVTLRASCSAGPSAVPPVELEVAGIATFPFDDPTQLTAASTLRDASRACGGEDVDEADLLLVALSPRGDPDEVREAIRRMRPDLHALTNDDVVARLQQAEFSYFRQISTVLIAVTLSFGVLLITVLLTVSVNQRLGEIAALRALGFSQRRVVADVLCEAALIIGIGGALALPIGMALARVLDRILKAMPGVPADLHFFVFQPRAVAVHIVLLVATAILAAVYPMWIVARLPIAATLRREVVS
jgi:ABC-type lipoprotein release transport system permease subunit